MQQQNRRLVNFLSAVTTVLLLSASAKAEERTVNFYNWSNYMALRLDRVARDVAGLRDNVGDLLECGGHH